MDHFLLNFVLSEAKPNGKMIISDHSVIKIKDIKANY